MSLTMRTGPFGAQPAGRFNATLSRPDPLLYFEPVPARIRALLEGETVVDSRRAMLLHGLHALEDGGLARAELSVQGENASAISLYESVGMRSVATTERWEKPLRAM